MKPQIREFADITLTETGNRAGYATETGYNDHDSKLKQRSKLPQFTLTIQPFSILSVYLRMAVSPSTSHKWSPSGLETLLIQ